MKILHLADEHVRDRDIEEIENILSFIIATAQTEEPDLIISAGDLFDSQDIRMGSRAALAAIRFISELADIAPVGIILGTPSHEGHAPEILRFARGNCPIRVASVPGQFILEAGEFKTEADNEGFGFQPEAILTLIPTPTKQFFQTTAGIEAGDQEIGQAMSGLFAGFGTQAAAYPGIPHVLVYHGGISGARLPSGHVRTGMDIEISTDQIRMAGGDSNFLGAFYPGGIYPVKVDEQGCGFFIHEIGGNDFIACLGHIHQVQILGAYGDEKRSRHIPTPCKRTVRFQRDLRDIPEGQDESVYVDGVSGSHVRYELTTWQDEAGEIDKAGIEKMLMEEGALSVDIRITRVPREAIRAVEVLDALTLRGKIVAQAEIKGEEVDPEILDMADRLENTPVDALLKQAQEGLI